MNEINEDDYLISYEYMIKYIEKNILTIMSVDEIIFELNLLINKIEDTRNFVLKFNNKNEDNLLNLNEFLIENLTLDGLGKILKKNPNYIIEIQDNIKKNIIINSKNIIVFEKVMFYINNKLSQIENNQSNQLKEVVMSKIKIFISHSSEDADLMENFVTSITNIFSNLKRSEIVCTSVDGCDIEIGKDIYDFIKDESKNSTITLGMLSRNSIKSETVLFELGIAWGLDKLKPIIIDDGYDFSDLPKPIENKKCLLLFETKGFNKLIDYLEDTLDLLKADTNTIDKFKKDFFDKYPKIKINDKESSINSKPTKDSKINEFENEWEKDKDFFSDFNLINNFKLVFKDSVAGSNENYKIYENDILLFLSKGLFDDINNIFKITEKGKYYFNKLSKLKVCLLNENDAKQLKYLKNKIIYENLTNSLNKHLYDLREFFLKFDDLVIIKENSLYFDKWLQDSNVMCTDYHNSIGGWTNNRIYELREDTKNIKF